jgi:hypothetical protein
MLWDCPLTLKRAIRKPPVDRKFIGMTVGAAVTPWVGLRAAGKHNLVSF